MNVSSSSKRKHVTPPKPGEADHLLTGLERLKEELGPIATELIDMLRRAGVDDQPPGANRSVRPSRE